MRHDVIRFGLSLGASAALLAAASAARADVIYDATGGLPEFMGSDAINTLTAWGPMWPTASWLRSPERSPASLSTLL